MFFGCINVKYVLSGCTYTTEVVEKDTSTPVLETEYESGQTVVCDVIRVADEPFSLACTYDTGNYPLEGGKRNNGSKGL